MALTNAERQAAWRKRMAARASGELVGEVARETMDAAIAATWDHFKRLEQGGVQQADIEGVDDLAAWRAGWVADGDEFAALLRELVHPENPDALTDVERAPIERALEIIEAVALRSLAKP